MDIENLEFRKIKRVDEVVTLRIEKMVNEGMSLAYYEDLPVFVRYALKGELVKVKIYKRHPKYAIAEPLEILEKSEKRITPRCPYFAMCGGCDYQHLSYQDQLDIKKELLLETFSRIGKINLNDVKTIENPTPFFYRNTMLYKVDPRHRKIGFFRKDTKSIIDIKECMLSLPVLNEVLVSMKEQENFPKYNFKSRANQKGEARVYYEESEKYQNTDIDETITVKGHSISFKISKDSFFQVNPKVIPLWLETIISFLDEEKSERIFDLYCGIGLITFFVSHYAKETIGIEIAKSSVMDANENIKRNNVTSNIKFIEADVQKELPHMGYADVIIVDPPRKGLDTDSLELLLEMEPKKIIYSSCKAATMARDINILSAKYDISDIYMVDMFSQTYHIEVLACLILK